MQRTISLLNRLEDSKKVLMVGQVTRLLLVELRELRRASQRIAASNHIVQEASSHSSRVLGPITLHNRWLAFSSVCSLRILSSMACIAHEEGNEAILMERHCRRRFCCAR